MVRFVSGGVVKYETFDTVERAAHKHVVAAVINAGEIALECHDVGELAILGPIVEIDSGLAPRDVAVRDDQTFLQTTTCIIAINTAVEILKSAPGDL